LQSIRCGVESVAWIAERKDVLSAVFFMLTLGAYVRYTHKQTLGRYVAMLILFACGLMSKGMLVTVPFVLLLLDYWPLGRLKDQWSKFSDQWSVVRGLILEKVPLFVLSAASCVMTVAAHSGATGASDPLPLTWRINDAALSYAIYIWQMIWPSKLAVLYPTNSFPVWEVIFAITFLLAATAFAIALRKTRPYIFVGWFWYLGMLIPVIGLFQIGWQSHADRYTYLPQIGIYLLATWAGADILKRLFVQRSVLNSETSRACIQFRRMPSALGIIFSSVIIAVLAWQAWNQTRFWKNSETLWTHTLAVTSNNDIAHHDFGLFLMERGQIDEAISHYQTALRIRSGAEEVRYRVTSALVHNNLGTALMRKGRLDEATAHYHKAIELRPDYADAHFNLGTVSLEKGQLDDAIEQWQKTLSIHPDDAEAHAALADALVQKHRIAEARSHYEASLDIDPHSVLTLNKLAWILSASPDASLRNPARAIELARKANQYSNGKDPTVGRTRAAACAESGHFDEAIETAKRAARMADAIGEHSLANKLEKDVDLYQQRSALRDFNLTNVVSGP
jgi:tetratricopeptide (TPR) repeat protein